MIKPTTTVGGSTATVDSTNIQVTLQSSFGSTVTAQFPTAQIKSIRYNGNGGDDLFMNSTKLASTYTTNATGTVSTSLQNGAPTDIQPGQADQLGVFTVGSTGQVSIDYLFDGAAYRGQVGIYSLSGMENLTPGSAAYKAEAARRIMTDSTLGHVVISVQSQSSKFEANLPWEADYHNGHGNYKGPNTFAMKPGDTFGIMLVPNGRIMDVAKNPSIGGDSTPLFSIPKANPYTLTPQLLGQLGDLDGHGSLFSFEDQRLDSGSDRDYNDVVFQVTGARGQATPVSEVVNPSRNFTTTPIFQSLEAYAAEREAADTSTVGTFKSGVFTVGSTGQVGVNYLFDGGGYNGQMAIFSLSGMGNLQPGSSAFIKEAARRALSNTVLGHVVIDKAAQGARTSTTLSWETNYNHGTYLGNQTFSMTPGDKFGIMLVPAGTVWQVYNDPTLTGKLAPLFSVSEANPIGSQQLADFTGQGTTLGFEDLRLDTSSDKDYNDLLFRLSGVTGTAPALASVVNPLKNLPKTTAAATILA